MSKKRELLKKAQDRLEYCKTNETAYLQLAARLGLLQEIPTNTWYAEGVQARVIAETRRCRAKWCGDKRHDKCSVK